MIQFAFNSTTNVVFCVILAGCSGRVADGMQNSGADGGIDALQSDALTIPRDCAACSVRTIATSGGVLDIVADDEHIIGFTASDIIDFKTSPPTRLSGSEGVVLRSTLSGRRVYWTLKERDDIRYFDFGAKTVGVIPVSRPVGVGTDGVTIANTLLGSAQVELRRLTGEIENTLSAAYARNLDQVFVRGNTAIWSDLGPPTSSSSGSVFLGDPDQVRTLAVSVRNLKVLSVGRARIYWATAGGTITKTEFAARPADMENSLVATELGLLQQFVGDDDGAFAAISRPEGGALIVRLATAHNGSIAYSNADVRAIGLNTQDIIWSDGVGLYAVRRNCTCP